MVQTANLPRTETNSRSRVRFSTALRRTSRRQMPVQDAGTQNLHLARELHDGLLQNLVYLDLELSSLKAEPSRPMTDAQLSSIRKVVQDGIQDLRGVLGSLRANAPGATTDRSGYAESLQQLLEDKADGFRTKCTAGIHIDANGCKQIVRPAPQAAPHVESIVSEAISNAVRHGKAHEIRVVLRQGPRGALITIIDDGCGFTPTITPAGHYGLRTMVERAEAIGGHLHIRSALGRGTRVVLYLPRTALRLSAVNSWKA